VKLCPDRSAISHTCATGGSGFGVFSPDPVPLPGDVPEDEVGDSELDGGEVEGVLEGEEAAFEDVAPLVLPAVALLTLAAGGVGWGLPNAGGCVAAEDSSWPPELVSLPRASSARTRAIAAAREDPTNELAVPGPMALPSATPAASISTARVAPTLREGILGTLGGRSGAAGRRAPGPWGGRGAFGGM
jgi:hypothetical protein